MLKASFIYFKNQNYEAALPLYVQLQSSAIDPDNKSNAKINAMRCAWLSKNYEVAATQADLILKNEKPKKELELEAKNIRAHSNFELGKLNECVDDFKYVSKYAESVLGAEAFFYSAKIVQASKKYKEVEKIIDKLMSYKYADKFWMTKGLLVMCDCYIEQKKYSDAEALLNTIVNNQVDETLKAEALKKLEDLKALQNQRMQADSQNQKTEGGTNVEFKNGTGNKDLFDELYENSQKDSTQIKEKQGPK